VKNLHYSISKCKTKKINNLKNGFTLIELVIVLAILSMSFIGISKFIKSSKWYENEINIDYCSISIMAFINDAKQYCVAEQSSGIIIISADKSTLKFTNMKNSEVKNFNFPSSFKLNYVTIRDKRISGNIINFNDGSSTDICSIFYKDSLGANHKITFSLGVENVDIIY
jgi:prepilin-type N-terminal cleavage/methylation domain-containing protein